MKRNHPNPIVSVLLSFLFVGLASAQYEPPRTADGKPRLDGVWTNSSLTRLSRPRNLEDLVLTPEKAEELASGHFHNVRAAKDLLPSDGDRSAPDKVERLPGVGNYNAGWVDPGTTYGVVDGEIRTSWLVEPNDGQVPYREDVLERTRGRRALRDTPDGPEVLSLGERCLIGFGGSGGPPMLNVLYNNHYRIVQTADHVVFMVEMVHDARVIPLTRERAAAPSKWLGESIGHWDGDTLVVETTNFHPSHQINGPLAYSREAKVVERFTRVADDEIRYEFEVEDDAFYSAKMRGEMPLRLVDGRVYEYACHEGNYAMGGILRGARLEEAEREAGAEP